MKHDYNWKDRIPHYIKLEELTADEKHKLIDSDVFCILPWIHLSAEPNSKVLPCCLGKMPLGDAKEKTLKEIWNDEPMRQLRLNMLKDKQSVGCADCYTQESTGTSSLRNGCNKSYGHHIKTVASTQPDGSLPDMKLYYWDVRFSSICNLKCRMCSSTYSSRWYDDELKLNNGNLPYSRIEFAGRYKTDVWEQMQEHLTWVTDIYFAGGEPLIMEEHNRVLKQLIDIGNTNVHLMYSTNLTELNFKHESIINLWKLFPKINVNISLDDIGDRVAVIRSGTDSLAVEQNLADLKRKCPHIDFLITPTVTIMNIWNICKAHRYLVEQQLIEPKDFCPTVLQHPNHYRIDILPADIKLQLKQELEDHIKWLQPLDTLQRATAGFKSVINFMMATDNSALLPDFWKTTDDIDRIRSEQLVDVVPELKQIEQYRKL